LHVRDVSRFANQLKARTVLDYGCGQAKLSRHLRFLGCHNYDPAIPRFAAEPPVCDLVVCTDVLEHVEPECLDSVLAHLREKARLGAFLVIALRYDSTKLLADGTNPHKIVQPGFWWRDKLMEHGWTVVNERTQTGYELKLWLKV
jgi:hypothetical protein